MEELIEKIGFLNIIILLFISIFYIICFAKIFKKTGRNGIISIIPIYNMWTLFEISNLSGWFSLIPIANIIMSFISLYKLSILFGKSNSFSIFSALFPYISLVILAFDKSVYKGYIEEKKDKSVNNNMPVFSSDGKNYNIIKDEEEIDYKKINNLKIDKHNNEFDKTFVDYSLKMVDTTLPDTKTEVKTKNNKFIVDNNKDDDIEIIDL